MRIRNYDLDEPAINYHFKERIGSRKLAKSKGIYDYHYNKESTKRVCAALEGLLKQSIGKKFDNVQSYFIHKYCKGNRSWEYRQWFIDMFANWEPARKYRSYTNYYIDDNGIIQLNPDGPISWCLKRKTKPIKYKWNAKKYPITAELHIALDYLLNTKYPEYNISDILHKEFDVSIINAIKNHLNKQYNWYYVDDLVPLKYRDCLKGIFNESYGSNWCIPIEYEEIELLPKSERIKAAAIHRRDRIHRNGEYRKAMKHNHIEAAEECLRIAKRQYRLDKAEAALSDKELARQNDLDIERLGFDKETSFRTPRKFGE